MRRRVSPDSLNEAAAPSSAATWWPSAPAAPDADSRSRVYAGPFDVVHAQLAALGPLALVISEFGACVGSKGSGDVSGQAGIVSHGHVAESPLGTWNGERISNCGGTVGEWLILVATV
jgi:hypothetical protein